MKKLFIIILIILILVLLIFFLIKKDFFGPIRDREQTGGSYDKTDSKAAKTIESKEITSFEYAFALPYWNQRYGRRRLYEHCTFSLVREDEGARCKGSGYGYGEEYLDFEFMAPLSALDDLHTIIDNYKLATSNGIHKGAIAIPEDLGGELRVKYASGEGIFASDNTGSITSDEANYAIYDFFIDLAIEADIGFEDTGDLDWELYKLMRKGLISEDGDRILKFINSQAFYYDGEELLQEGKYGIAIADDHIQIIKEIGKFDTFSYFKWMDGRFFGIEYGKDPSEFFPLE